jgi:hypothetical protein
MYCKIRNIKLCIYCDNLTYAYSHFISELVRNVLFVCSMVRIRNFDQHNHLLPTIQITENITGSGKSKLVLKPMKHQRGILILIIHKYSLHSKTPDQKKLYIPLNI